MAENIDSRYGIGKGQEAREIMDSLWEKLPSIAQNLIRENQDLSDERNRRFLEHPDDLGEHDPNWHQWGIITHTKMFEKYYQEEMPRYLDQWGVHKKIQTRMSEEIDGMSKEELLRMAIPLHDLGKFTARNMDAKGGPTPSLFKKHEADSGKIIRSSEFSGMLRQEYGLTDAQIGYIARCAELHYELGLLREEAKKSDLGYTLAYARSDSFKEQAKELMARHPDFQLEMGMLFLVDTLAKTDIRIEAETDGQIEPQTAWIAEKLRERGMNPKLINAVKQMPVNIAVAGAYLRVWAED